MNKHNYVSRKRALCIISFVASVLALCALLHGQVEKKSVDRYHHVRAGAKGKNDGSNWINAWTSLPDKLQRGHTYYIASGSYKPWVLNTPEQDGKVIRIIKATDDDHGSNTGWNSSYGKGQAIIQSMSDHVVKLTTGHWIIDGAGDVMVPTYGIKFQALPGGKVPSVIIIIDETWKSRKIRNISIRHCEIQHHGCDKSKGGGRGFYVHSQAGLTDGNLHHLFIHDIPGIPIYFVNTTNSIVEYCHVARNHSDRVSHSEAIQVAGSCPNNIIRYNIFEDIEGTAIVVGDEGWKVYGNLAFYTRAYVDAPQLGRHAPGVLCSNFVGMGLFTTIGGGKRNDCKVFNNTIVGNNTHVKEGGNLGTYLTGAGNVVYNNIWANCRRIRIVAEKADYNLLYNNGDGGHKEPHLQRIRENPFVNPGSHDYRLKFKTDPGKTFEPELNKDMTGNVRGKSGHWSRGAYEYDAALNK